MLYSEKLESIKNKLLHLEKERSQIYKMLDKKSAFDALKSAYIEQLDRIEKTIASKKSELSDVVVEIVSEKNTHINTINNIKETYLDLVESSVDIDISDATPYFNFEFQSKQNSPVSLSLEVPRGSSLGKSRFKILAFDLSVFLTCVKHDNNFPNFLIHDGAFHAIAHKTSIKFLNYIKKQLNQLDGAQYIITVNEDEIIFPEQEEVAVSLDFDLEEKTLITLEDNPDSMLFKKEFC